MNVRFARRPFLQSATCLAVAAVAGGTPSFAVDQKRPSLTGAVGITTSTLSRQRVAGELNVQTLPKFMRDELGMKLIDLNTRWLKSFDERYLQSVRAAAEDAGCFFSNLKVNHSFGDLYSSDGDERKKAMTNARQMVETAHTLGTRWIRFFAPRFEKGDDNSKLAAHRELAIFAKELKVQMLVENYAWLQNDPDSIERVVGSIGDNVAACPDIGNWNNDIRYAALAKAFSGAASCDFKAFELSDQYEHKKYDLRRCFEIGWKAGFRGPWAIEHVHKDTKRLVRELVHLRDQLQQWTKDHEK